MCAAGSALKALLSHLANDHQLSTIAVLAHHYQATPQIGYAIQVKGATSMHKFMYLTCLGNESKIGFSLFVQIACARIEKA